MAAERKAKAEAEAAANKKSRAQRIAHHQTVRKAQLEEEDDSSDEEDEEDEVEKRERLRKTEQDADLKHAEDLFGEIGISNQRSAPKKTIVVSTTAAGASKNTAAPDGNTADTGVIDLSTLPLFKPKSKEEFERLSQTLIPLLTANARQPQYSLTFLPDFIKQLTRDLSSAEIKKVSSVVALSLNEKLKEEKAAEKGGKKTKAAKTKASLVANRDTSHKADTTSYDDGMEE